MPRRHLPLFVVALLASAAAAGQSTPAAAPALPRSVTVTGTGTVTGEPDEAHVQLTVQKSNPAMDKARAEAVAVVERFLALTKRLGIDAKKVRTTSAVVNPEYRWDQPTGRQVLIGYSVQRQLEVELTNLDQLGALIEGAVDAGVTHVSPPQLDSSKRRELNRQALAAAARDAEANARAIAGTLGMKLGALRDLSAGDASPPPPMPMPMMRATAMAAEVGDTGAATYQRGSLDFEARVTATFDLLAP
ncbi:MAG: SIMPL domain-containing protein [Gammaproteobacteria bacterium]|nr:SIMPL domain-containing protein [Gammaproteobacteria bacterium]